MVLIVDSDVFVAELTFAEIISLRGIPMSLGGLVDKILVYRSCIHRFHPSYGTSFFFFFFNLFDHAHTHICVFGVQRVNA